MVYNNNALTQKMQKLEIFTSSLAEQIRNPQGGILATLNQQGQQISALNTIQSATPPSPVGNLLYNGEIGHSVNSWFDSSYVVGDKADEAAFFFSNGSPAASEDFTTIVTNKLIPLPGHDFVTGTPVRLFNHGGGETAPTPLNFVTTYYVINIDPNNVAVSNTAANSFLGLAGALNVLAGTGSGTHTLQPWMDETDARTSSGNSTLKNTSHSQYNPNYSKWISTNGEGALQGVMSIDAMMPTNWVDATVGLARVSLICARRNAFIEIPTDALFGAGIWDATDGQCKFIEGDIGFFAALDGAIGTTERRFRALLTSDRGYQLLSDEITIANAPADAALAPPNSITMGWRQQSGQLQVDLYEHYDPGGPNDQYRLLSQVSSSTSFIYEGNYLYTVSGYPTPTGTLRSGTFYTQPGDMSDMAINGVAAQWDTCNFPISVPNNYNKANTTGRQWVRIWQTVAANMFVPGCTSAGGTTITAPTAVFDAEYSSLYSTLALTIEFYDSNNVLQATRTISSRTNDTQIVVSSSVTAGTYSVRIVAGGFHGVLVDKIHLGFQQNTGYVPNANDNRTLQPVAAPTHSDQGGTGDGGSGGGIGSCIAFGTPMKLQSGEWVECQDAKCGPKYADGSVYGNILIKMRVGFDHVRRIRWANGIEIECTDTERFVADDGDIDGTTLLALRVGDFTMTELDGRKERSKIVEISPYLRRTHVYTPWFGAKHLFIAGRYNPRRWSKAWWKQLFRRRKIKGAAILHNRKNLEQQ